jgi:Xaa-Pro aminopeptidase
MFLSNEPGYYKAGEYGIRIENLVLVEEREITGAEGCYFGFETLTFAPIDKTLVDVSLLSGEELLWWNDYHAKVRLSRHSWMAMRWLGHMRHARLYSKPCLSTNTL